MKKRIATAVLVTAVLLLLTGCSGGTGQLIADRGGIDGLRVAAVEGTVAMARAIDTAEDGSIEIISLKTTEDAAAAVKDGLADCFLVDSPQASAASRGLTLEVLDNVIDDLVYRFAVAKENADLTKAVNEALGALRADGTLTAIVNGYLASTDYRYETDLSGYDAEITLAVHSGDTVFCFKAPDGVAGIEPDIAKAVCGVLGVNLDVRDYSGASRQDMVRMAETGLVTFSACRFTAEEYPDNTADFTDGYYTSSQKLIVRK